MVMLVLLAVALATVPLTGGRLAALLELRFKATWLLLLAVAIQLALVFLPGETSDLRLAAHMATYPIGLAFIWANRRVPGLLIIGFGALLNGIAIAANGGVMPASLDAYRVAGLEPDPEVYANSAVLAEPRLLFLGDVFAIPASWPFSNVFSVGDVVILVGAVVTIHAVCRDGPKRRGR